MIDPFGERLYVMVFICGAVFYSFIYGNIGQFLESMYASGQRYRKRMDEITSSEVPRAKSHHKSARMSNSRTRDESIKQSISQQLPSCW